MNNEYSFLYSCLNNNEALKEVPHLNKVVFADPIASQIFEVLQDLLKKGFTPNINTIKSYLDEASYSIFVSSITSETNISDYAIYLDSIKNSYSYMQLEKAGAILHSGVENKVSPMTIANSIQEQLKQVYFAKNVGMVKSSKQLMDEIVQEFVEDYSASYLGIPDLDKITGPIEPGNIVIIAGRPSMGKCLGAGTKILMFDGTLKNAEDVIVGDRLMGPDSNPRNVLSVTSGKEQMYWIKQKRGIDYRVNESHILSLKRSRNDHKHKNGDVLNISVKEYLSKSPKFHSNYKGYKVAIEFSEQKVDIDPYLLGLWLGDGKSSDTQIFNIDPQIFDYIKASAIESGMKTSIRKYGEKCPSISIIKGDKKENIFLRSLKKLNLLNNKHIPQCYINNSSKNRLRLLAGLIDSDGYYQSKDNIIEIMQKNDLLSSQIKLIADSLGFCVSIKKVKKSIKSTGFNGVYNRIIISGNLDIIPVVLKRKTPRKLKSIRDWRHTAITIEKDIMDSYYGFELDGDGLFLLEDCTVTHNTAALLQILINQAIYGGQPVVMFSLEMGAKALMKRIIANVAGISLTSIRLRKLTERQAETFNSVKEQIENSPLHIIDNVFTVAGMEANLELLKTQYPELRYFGMDYIQLMENTNETISNMMREIKRIGKKLEMVPILASQLSRVVETREDKRPMLSDLRDSGSIEQDADIIIFPFREAYYDKAKAAGEANKSATELIVAKNRDGETGTAHVIFDKNIQRFSGYKSKTP